MDAKLLKQAMLGTDKGHHVDVEPHGRIDTIESLADGVAETSPPWNLLLKAGCYSVAERAGFMPDTVSGTYTPPIFTDNRRDLSPRFAECLTRFLKEFPDTPQVSIHLLKQVDEAKLRLPAGSVPEFLVAFSQRRMFKENAHGTVLSLIGERGRWLAAQNTDWIWASNQLVDEIRDNTQKLDSLWTEGTFRERESVLKIIAENDASEAKRRVCETWKNEKAEHREAFLNVLSKRFDDTDIPFLEESLKDRSASIRQTVATLLAQLPNSDYAGRTLERAETILVRGTKPNTLCVNPPTEFTKTMKADGLEEKPPRGVGEKAWWISESLRRVPLTHWEKRFQMSPSKILAALSNDDDYASVLHAWTYTVQWFPEHDHWFEPLWDAWNAVKKSTVCRSCPERCFDDEPEVETTPPKWSIRLLETLRQWWLSRIRRRS